MRGAERLRRWLARGEVRAALAAGGGVALLLGVQALLFYAYVASEYVEEATRELSERAALLDRVAATAAAAELDGLLAAIAQGDPGTPLAVRLERPGGASPAQWGAWPEAGAELPFASAWDQWTAFAALGPGSFLARRVGRPGGLAFDVALPLSHYRQEIAEVRDGLLAILAVSLVAGVAIALAAVRRSFAPLRAATVLLESMRPEPQAERLASRGTGDFVDQHAAALNAALDRIASAFQRLRAFSGDVAHELRTPINRIRNAAELGLMGGAGAEGADEALHTVLGAAQGLSRLVDGLLLLARLDEEVHPLATARIEAGAWIGPLLELYRPLCSERGIALGARVAPLSLRGDPGLLDRALCNLLDNAIVHGGGGGRIEVTAEERGGGIEVAVSDAGPGVPERDRERIFDRFARLDAARARPGTGLGLALARAIARAHGGTLAASEAPGGGARFALWLPASRRAEESRGGEGAGAPAADEDFVIFAARP